MLKKLLFILLLPGVLIGQDLFSQLDKSTMETTILYDRAYQLTNLTTIEDPINATYFIQSYSELSQADYGNHFANIENLKDAANKGFRDNYIPLGLLNVAFDVLKPDAVERGLLTLTNGQLISNTDQSLFNQHQRTIISPLTAKFKGLRATFKLLPEYITNTTGETILSIKANFHTGLGFQTVTYNDAVSVTYPSEGKKHIDFEIEFSNGRKVYNSAYVIIEPSSADLNMRAPGDESPITPINSTLTYQGEGEAMAHLGTGEYKIYYDNVDGIFDKPIIFVDGFDPGDGRTIPLMYDLLNFGNPVQNLAEVVRDQGFDLVVLNFPTYVSASDGLTVIDGGADFIQRNAYILVELFNTINAQKVGDEQNVIIGPSMGGLISRYALRYMEQNSLDPETRLFISFDSPHRGANVPIGIQYLFNYMLNGDPGVVALEPLVNGLLNSAAAKQMLVDHFSAHLMAGSDFLQDPTKTTPVGAENFRDAFQEELNMMGFPQTVRNVSMINGSGIGNGTGTPGTNIIDHTFDTGLVGGFPTRAIINTNFKPSASSTLTVADIVGEVFFGVWIEAFSYDAVATSPSYTDGVDSAQGGQFDLGSFDDGSDPLITEFVNNLNIDKFDFIPSVSAMALDVTPNDEIDWYHTIDIGSGSPPSENQGDVINATPFINWYMPDDNEIHVTLTESNVMFALTEIFNETLGTNSFDDTIIQLEKNPVSDHLGIIASQHLTNVSITLYDVMGRSALSQTFDHTSNRYRMPLQLQAGLYILELRSDEGSFTSKVIIN